MEGCIAGVSASLNPFSSPPPSVIFGPAGVKEKGEEPQIAAFSCIFLLITRRFAVTSSLK